MVSDLVGLKEVCVEASGHGNTELKVEEELWTTLEQIKITLEPAYVATKQLQTEQLTLPDARKVIQVFWLRTAELGTPLSQEIINNLETERVKMLESQAMLNACFVDPRHLFELTEENRVEVKRQLTAVHKRLQSLIEDSKMKEMSSNDHDNGNDVGSDSKSDVSDVEMNDVESLPHTNFMDNDGDDRYEEELRRKHKDVLLHRKSASNRKNLFLNLNENWKNLRSYTS